jgi:hypothetical protein
MSPDIEEELREYLRAQKEADATGAMKRMADWCVKHDTDDKVRHEELSHLVRETRSELHHEIRGVSLRVGVLEKSGEKLEDRVDQSGSWEREALQAQLHIARQGSWFLRNWPSVVSALVAVVALLAAFMKGHG